MKKPYARIDFVNCDTDYDYTICEWWDVPIYIHSVENACEGLDEVGFEIWNDKLLLPSATISIVMMTSDEFSEWFTINIESKA